MGQQKLGWIQDGNKRSNDQNNHIPTNVYNLVVVSMKQNKIL